MNRIRVESDGAIARITLARPEKRNALDHETAHELLQAFTSCAQHTGTRVVVLDADGADFCAGADLTALAEMLDARPEEHYADAESLGRVFIAMREMPKPVVAVVRGRALAGGAGLATAADIVLAHEGAQFGYPEVLVGFVPAMVMTMLRRAVGEKRAYELVATGRRIGASEALQLGLVSRVLDAEGFEARVNDLVGEIAQSSASAQALTKTLFYQLDGLDFRDGVLAGARANVAARSTADFRTGVLRFAKRR
ncbi:MAG: enoyl-CoA hydratase-related protein [Gemmatimonadota bacterium]|nr:enoyl-CoA hydratase-related protein [Gemmatimonadota bacterium]